MYLRSIVAALLLCLCGPSMADSLKAESEIRGLTDKAMNALLKGGPSATFAIIKPYTIVPPSEFESTVMASKAQRDQFSPRYGKTVGVEFISQKKVGESLVRVIYIEKTEKHALPWMFFFYKSPGGWVINAFLWNDQLPMLFVHE